jgi:hypothetical protein
MENTDISVMLFGADIQRLIERYKENISKIQSLSEDTVWDSNKLDDLSLLISHTRKIKNLVDSFSKLKLACSEYNSK